MNRKMLRRVLTLVLVAVALPAVAAAQRFEVTPFVGYRIGGGLQDFDFEQDSFDFQDTESLGVALSIALREGVFLEILYSGQETTLEDESGFQGDQPLFDLDVDYWHIGGLYEFDTGQAFKPFVVGTLGVTEFDPQPAGISGETRFSIGIGGGAKMMFGENVGFRFEGRGFTTFVNSNTQVFCDPFRCYGYSSGTYMWQFEGRVGLILAFGG